MTAHPTAIIETGATIAEDVRIGPFAFIGADVTVGEGCVIGQGVRIEGNTVLGRENRIGAYTVLGTPPQSMRHKDDSVVGLTIGDRNRIMEYCLISAGTDYESKMTRVGDDNYIMAYCHLGHDVQMGSHIIMANTTQLGGHVHVGDRVVFGAGAGVHQFVRIGEFAMLGGLAAVTQDIPPYCLAEGNRARLRGLNAIGIRRGIGSDAVNALKPAYKQLFRGNQGAKEVAQVLEKQSENEYVRNLCRFVLASKRGVPYRTDREEA